MNATELGRLSEGSLPYKERRWPRVVILFGMFLILLYLYYSLSEPPLPPSGAQANGVSTVFSIYGWGKERLDNPNAVATDKSGNIYIADAANHRIAVFDPRGNFRFVIGKKAKVPSKQVNEGPIVFPTGLAVADNGEIFVASMQRNLILVFSSAGKFKRELRIEKPISLTIVKNRLYATTPGQIWVYSLRGDLINRWGSFGKRLKEFQYPNGLALDKKGNLFISDTENSRIQILNPNGDLVGWKGAPPQNLNDPQRTFGLNMGLTIDDQERVFVVDAFRHSIHVFDHEGNELGEFGEKGVLDGRFNYPAGIAYLGGAKFAVADKWNDRVQVIRLAIPSSEDGVLDRAQSLLPYLLLALLILLLLFLSWRRRRMLRAEQALQEGLGG